jgi:hypothetical protein
MVKTTDLTPETYSAPGGSHKPNFIVYALARCFSI